MKTADLVLLSLLMRDNGSCDSPQITILTNYYKLLSFYPSLNKLYLMPKVTLHFLVPNISLLILI